MSWRNSNIKIKQNFIKKKAISKDQKNKKHLRILKLLKEVLGLMQYSTKIKWNCSRFTKKLILLSYNKLISKRFKVKLHLKRLQVRNPIIFKKFREVVRTHSGRNHSGKITVRHQGGNIYRSFIRNTTNELSFSNIPTRLIYSHFMGQKIASKVGLCYNIHGVFSYMLVADKLKVFSNVFNSAKKISNQTLVSPGSRTLLKHIPTGSLVYNIELNPNTKPQLARAAGTAGKIMLKKSLNGHDYAGVVLPSKKLIYIPLSCQASIGITSNPLHKLNNINFAGIKRKCGVRPAVRGVAMNPIDHHHGGGEGKTSSGPKPKTAWGKTWRYVKTRSDRKESSFKIFNIKMNKYGLNIASKKKNLLK